MPSLVTLNEYSIFLIGSGLCLVFAGIATVIAQIRRK